MDSISVSDPNTMAHITHNLHCPAYRNQKIPWSVLTSPHSTTGNANGDTVVSGANQHLVAGKKSFAAVVNKHSNVSDFDPSQLPKLCLKGDELSIKIPELAYQECLAKYKNHLHDRLLLPKGSVPLTTSSLKLKLTQVWKLQNQWNHISLGKGFFEFVFQFEACKEFGLDDVHIDEMVREIDQDNDGQIDYGEFAAITRKGNGGIGRRTMRRTFNFRDALGIIDNGSKSN